MNANEFSERPSKPIPACTAIPNCPLSVDIVLVSSYGDRFGTHSKNLGEFTGGFPLDIAPANGEDVPLLDLNSETISLFLQYIHHHRQPDLSRLSFKSLSQLAEAVEKYDVYSATEICKVQMSRHVENHCVEVFQYASKHGYRKLMDDAGLIAIQNKYWTKEIPDVCNRPALQSAWYRYNDYWLGLFSDCLNEPHPVVHPGRTPNCNRWRKFKNVVVSQVRERRELAIFSKFDDIVEGARHYLEDCPHCGIRADRWAKKVKRRTIIGEKGELEGIDPFTTFLT